MDSKGNLIGFGKQPTAKRRKVDAPKKSGGGGFANLMASVLKDKQHRDKKRMATAAAQAEAEAAAEEVEPAPLVMPTAANGGANTTAAAAPVRMVKKLGEVDLPVTEHVVMRGHDNAVTAIDIDRTGTRMVTGSMDYKVKLWQFAGMDSSLRAFRDHEPHEGYPVNDISFSPTGGRYVASVSNARPIIFDRDGKELLEFMNGDVYVRQEIYTRGHTATTHSVRWCPDDESCIITASVDGTVRVWDAESVHKKNTSIIVHGRATGGRKPEVFAAELNGTKKAILSAGADGRICVWPRAGPYTRPSLEIKHGDASVCGIASTADGRYITSRGTDSTVKLWDVRNPKSAVAVRGGLGVYYDTTSVVYGHGDRVIATGTAADPTKGERGRLVLLNAKDLEPLADVPVGVGSVGKVVWSAPLNQIFVGCQDNGCHVFYDPVASTKGVLLSLAKKRKYDPGEMSVKREIICPTSERDIKELLQQATHKKASVKHHMLGPAQVVTVGDGAAAAQRVSSQQAFLMEHLPDVVGRGRGDAVRAEDPQQALLKYAEEAEKNPQFVDQAYKNQPKVFLDTMDEGEDKRKWKNV